MGRFIVFLIALYYRVSTPSQRDDMQMGANQSYVEQMGIKEYTEFNDHGVSATKNELRKRPQLVKLLESIKAGQINHVIVYARDRLSRDMYEYSNIIQIFYDYNVKITFTMKNHITFQQTRDMELLAFLFSDQEGKNIQNRTGDTYKRSPHAIFGYKKISTQNHSNFYKVKIELTKRLADLFNLCLKVQTPKEMLDFLEDQRRILNRSNVFDILKILQNPFYSGHCEEDYGFQSLTRVEPVVPLDVFLNVREHIQHFSKTIFDAINNTPVLHPYCALCNQQMKLRENKVNNAGLFLCRNNHPRVAIQVDELTELLKQALTNHFRGMSTKKLKTVTRATISKIINETELSIRKAREEIEVTNIDTSVSYPPNKPNPLVNQRFQHIRSLNLQVKELVARKYNLELARDEIDTLYREVHKGVIHESLSTKLRKLANLVVDKVEISNGNAIFHFFFKEFVALQEQDHSFEE